MAMSCAFVIKSKDTEENPIKKRVKHSSNEKRKKDKEREALINLYVPAYAASVSLLYVLTGR